MTRYTYYPNDALKVAKPIVIPRVVDYRMKPGRSMFARGAHECHPEFRSLWDGLTAGWFFLEEGLAQGTTDVTDAIRDEIGHYPLDYDYVYASGASFVVAEHGLAHRKIAGVDVGVTGLPSSVVDTAGRGSVFGFTTLRSLGSVAGLYCFQFNPTAGSGYHWLTWTTTGTFKFEASNASDQGVFYMETAAIASTLNKSYAFCATWNADTELATVYVNGESAGEDSGWLNPPSTFPDLDQVCGSNDAQHDVYYAAMWNRDLTPEEAIKITREPFGPFWKGAY